MENFKNNNPESNRQNSLQDQDQDPPIETGQNQPFEPVENQTQPFKPVQNQGQPFEPILTGFSKIPQPEVRQFPEEEKKEEFVLSDDDIKSGGFKNSIRTVLIIALVLVALFEMFQLNQLNKDVKDNLKQNIVSSNSQGIN